MQLEMGQEIDAIGENRVKVEVRPGCTSEVRRARSSWGDGECIATLGD